MWAFSHLSGGVWLPPLPPGYGPGKGGWGTVRVAGVHAARMIRPMHPIPCLHIWQVLHITETIKVRQESFIMDMKKKLLPGPKEGGVKPPNPAIGSATTEVTVPASPTNRDKIIYSVNCARGRLQNCPNPCCSSHWCHPGLPPDQGEARFCSMPGCIPSNCIEWSRSGRLGPSSLQPLCSLQTTLLFLS